MRINTFKKSIAVSSVIVPILASSASAADIQIWSNEKELENGNHLILDADDTGGDVFLQFGNTLGESLSWDSANARFNLSNNLNVEGNISLTGNVEMQALATVDGVDVSELGSDVSALENRVATNETNIAGNTSNIATNRTDIDSNDTDISNLDTRVTTNENDIDTLETKVGDTDFTGANYLVFGSDLTQGLLKLDSQIKTNTDNIATNATDIDNLEADQASQNTNIETNATDIDNLEADLAAAKPETHLIPLGGVTIKEDGSNNTVNVFRSADDTGFGHNYHTVKTSQTVLQDINLDFEIKTPADVRDLTSVTFSYKTDGSSSDSKIDIKVVDKDGNTIATNTGLSAGSWTDAILDISGHTATAGELLTVEVTGYTKDNNSAYIGELLFDYTENK